MYTKLKKALLPGTNYSPGPKFDPEEYPKWKDTEEKTLERTFTTYTLKIIKKDGTEQYMECEDYRRVSERRSDNDYLQLDFLYNIITKDYHNPKLTISQRMKREINMDEVYYWEEVDSTTKKAVRDVTVGTKLTTKNGEYLKEETKIKEKHGEAEVINAEE